MAEQIPQECWLNITQYLTRNEKLRVRELNRWFRDLHDFLYKTTLDFKQSVDSASITRLYRTGEKLYQRKDFSIAKFFYTIAADKGHASSLLNLGQMYAEGEGVEIDDKKAFEHYSNALKNGCYEANYSLGIMYKLGRGVTKDIQKARECFDKAIEQGYYWAHVQLGRMDLNKQGYEREDYRDKAKDGFAHAVAKGCKLGELELAWMYLEHEPVNVQMGLEHFQRAIKADLTEAYVELGFLYRFGLAVPTDVDKAIENYQTAIEKGDGRGCYALGRYFYEKKEYEKARELFEKGEKMGADDCGPQLGWLYLLGLGVPSNPKKAWDKFHKSRGSVNSQICLGLLYEFGVGDLPRDYAQALAHYTLALNRNCLCAQVHISRLYFNGQGVEKDSIKACQLLDEVMALENAFSLYDLGVFFEEGHFIKDLNLAQRFFKRSSDKGCNLALEKLK
eukprot:TRINITY_DN3081_c0_g1_i1.p1 TRINITY_DN3081_c0_g1~~TRINITY_DN3081_c0_g1_i1.p1  ORF type:complete len:449 (+),score=73.17 TRINITY_DN3081_c0_g1_i1:14-1360(+)